MGIAQDGAAAFDDDDGVVFEPIAHLGEGVPEVLVVEFGQFAMVHAWSNRR